MSLWNWGCGILFWIALVSQAVILARKYDPDTPSSGHESKSIFFLQAGIVVLMVASLVAWRIPSLCLNRGLHVDEDQFLAEAITYRLDPLPWRSSNGGTVGPLDTYVLVWPALLGMPISYATARITGLICVFITIFSYLKIASLFVGRKFSTLGILPLIAFYTFAFQPDFVHYSSEHLPMALLAVSMYLLVKLYRQPQWGHALLLGLILGAIPLTKLQAGPLAVYLFLVGWIILLFRQGFWPKPGEAAKNGSALLGGVLIVPGVVLLPVFYAGFGGEFLNRYLLFGLQYHNAGLSWEHSESIVRHAGGSNVATGGGLNALLRWNGFAIIGHGGEVSIYLATMSLLCLAGLILLQRQSAFLSPRWHAELAVIVGYVAMTIFVIIQPGNHSHHYLLFLIGPVMLLFLWFARGCLKQGNRPTPHPFPIKPVLLYALIVTVPCLAWRGIDPYSEGPGREWYLLPGIDADAVVQYLKSNARPGDSLAVWGWCPRYYVGAQLPSGTRDVVGGDYMLPGDSEEGYREGYLSDLERNKPRWFVDCAELYYWSGGNRPLEQSRHHTSYPLIADYIARNYSLAASIPQANEAQPTLIYVRRN